MNMGLLTGYVIRPSGGRVSGANVWLFSVMGDNAQVAITPSRPGTTSDSRGRFALSFGWSGAEFAEGLMSISLYLASYIDLPTQNGYSAVGGKARVSTPGYIIQNVGAGLSLATPELTSATGLLGFTKDLIEAYRKIKAVPIPGVEYMSTETKLMLGAATIQLDG